MKASDQDTLKMVTDLLAHEETAPAPDPPAPSDPQPNRPGPGVLVYEARGRLIMAEGAYINPGSQVRAVGANVTLGYKAGVGYNVLLITSYGSHYLGDEAMKRKRPIVIGDHAWIGYGAMIRGGVTIGKWATVGMGSVILQDVPDYMIAVGNPARIVGRRPDYKLVLEREEQERKEREGND